MQSSIPIKDLLAGGSALVTADFKDQAGNPIAPQDTPLWASSDPAIATVSPAPDGLSATVTGIASGEATITVTANGASSRLIARVESLKVTDIGLSLS